MKLSPAIFLVLLGYLSQTECILKGDIVSLQDLRKFKYLVSIRAHERGERGVRLCGGGILNDYMILTAAHCLADQERGILDLEWVTVRAQTLTSDARASEGSIVRRVERVYVPTEYFFAATDTEQERGSRHSDIAIIKLRNKLYLRRNSHKVKALTLPGKNYKTLGKKGVVAGYGAHISALSETGKVHFLQDGQLRKMEVEVVSGELLDLYYVKAKPIGDEHSKGFCVGDSGSPLVVKSRVLRQPVVIGVVARNNGLCDDVLKPGSYTRVSYFLKSFINKVLENPDIIDNGIRVRDIPLPAACNNN